MKKKVIMAGLVVMMAVSTMTGFGTTNFETAKDTKMRFYETEDGCVREITTITVKF